MTRYWALGLALLALLLRVIAAMGDLWLDEVWSLRLVAEIQNPLNIFGRLKHDNNHPLNSLWLWCCGSQASVLAYRSLSIVSGVLAVYAAGAFLQKRGLPVAIFTWLTLGLSFPLIHYSSEARGYAAEMLFAVTLVGAMERHENENHRLRWAIVGAASTLAGCLAHATFLFAVAGIWCVLLGRQFVLRAKIQVAVLLLVAMPVLAAICYRVLYHDLEIGGGNTDSALKSLSEMIAISLGGPRIGIGNTLYALAGVLLIGAFVYSLATPQDKPLLSYLIAAMVFPIVGGLVSTGTPIYPRYFLMSALMMLWILGWGLGVWWERRGRYRIAAAALFVMIVVGNLIPFWDLAMTGRGNYSQAVSYIATKANSKSFTIGSDHDFRNSMLLSYYADKNRLSDQLRYLKQDQWHAEGLDWMVLHTTGDASAFPLELQDASHNTYVLRRVFRYDGGLSGWHWGVYQQERRR